MPAPTNDLVEALNRFDPVHSLESFEQLRDYYVARAHSPLEPLYNYLKARRQPAKLLFMGHIGSGKSTELAKLRTRLSDEFLVVHFSAGQRLNISDLEPVDVVLGCALALLEQAIDLGLLQTDPLLTELTQWLGNEVVTESVVKASSEPSVTASLKLLIVTLSAKWNAESTTRQTLRPRLQSVLTDLTSRVNRVIKQLRDNGRPPIILVEDLDKTNLGQAKRVFFEEGQVLRLLDCHVVYTFPIALRYSNDYSQIKNNFEYDFKLPNMKLQDRLTGAQDEPGWATLRQLVTKRASPELFTGGAVDRAIELSGGLVKDLVRLLQGAVLSAMVNGSGQISVEMVEGVAAEIRSDFRALLQAEHYELLRRAGAEKEVINEPAVVEVLHNLSLLEYRNAQDWCDVHPIVKPLLSSGPATHGAVR